MRHHSRLPLLVGLSFALSALSGCLAGHSEGNSEPPIEDPTPGDPNPNPPGGKIDDPERDRALMIVCKARLGIKGQFSQSAPPPADNAGCWPVGTWSFKTTIIQNGCSPPPSSPPMVAEWQFKVEQDVDFNITYTYLNDPAYDHVRMKVTGDGGGVCQGGFEVYSLDGKANNNMKPALNADGSLNGFADYEVYNDDQW